jgi:hypothetical protein
MAFGGFTHRKESHPQTAGDHREDTRFIDNPRHTDQQSLKNVAPPSWLVQQSPTPPSGQRWIQLPSG